MRALARSKSSPAQAKPTMGESSRDLPMLAACSQSTPLVPLLDDMSWLAIPSPITEPMRVWELEAGRPNHQVPRFQIIAATSKAKTMANPALLPTCRISSTGSRETMANATSPDEAITPRKFQNPDQTTATCGSSEWV